MLWIPLIFVSFALAQIEWPWNPDESLLDLGDLADLHQIHEVVSLLEDRQHHTLALKDLVTHVCYLIDTQTSHLTTQQIINDIRMNGNEIVSSQFYAQFPPLDHDALVKYGHRIGVYCQHNPTITLGRKDEMPVPPQPVGN